MLIEQLCENPSEDWQGMLVISDRARYSSQSAQETMRTLTQIFYENRSLNAKLNAARIWSVLLGSRPSTIHGGEDDLVNHTCSRSFLVAIKTVIDQRMGGDALRDRLVDIIGAGAWSLGRGNRQHPLVQLWLQVKPYTAPDEVRHFVSFIRLRRISDT